MKKVLLVLIPFIALVESKAQWNPDPTVNNPVVTVSTSTQKSNPTSYPDGNGGMWISWEETRGATGSDLYLQRINNDGTIAFDANGIVVSNAANNVSNASITDDGAGGIIIVWQDNRVNASAGDIYVQRYNSSGVAQYAVNGIAAVGTESNEISPVVMRVNTTDFYIVWRDSRNGNVDLFANKYLISTGAKQFITDVQLAVAANTQQRQIILPDMAGGIFAVWEDQRAGGSETDIFVQRIDNSGIALWGANGLNICNAAFNQLNPQIAPDGVDGIVATWTDNRAGTTNQQIYAQRINASGAPQWTANGVVVTDAPLNQNNPFIINDGSTNTIIVWSDNRVSTSDRNIYIQKLNSAGVAQWTANGTAVCTLPENQPNAVSSLNIVSDGANGAIVCWDDNRANNTSTGLDIYAQRISSNGTMLWTMNGVPVATKPASNQRVPTMVSDGSNGAIIAWLDGRTATNGEIYASHVFAGGTLPVEFIAITAAQNKDVIAIAWKATCDNMTDRFVIEKSSDSRQFSSIGSVQANIVNGKCVADFAFNDVNLLNGTNYYRIKGIDKDGKFTYSTIAKVTVNAKGVVVHLSPNPVRDVANVRLTNFNKGNYQLRIADATGKIVQASTVNVQLPFQQQSLSIGSLNSGTYILNVIDAKGNMITSTRFIKQ